MIAARRFQVLHTPFVGGSFLRRALALHAPAAWQVRLSPGLPGNPHAADGADDMVRILPVLGPWEWYVAWYARQHLGSRRDATFQRLSENGALDFGETMERLFATAAVCEAGIGPYSMVLEQAAGSYRSSVRSLKVERVRTEIARVLREIEDPGDDVVNAIVNTPETATDRHPHWARFHTPRTRELIERHDGAIMAELGYAWPAAEEPQPAPGLLLPTQGVSFPRSGHSALFSVLRHYFFEDVILCDAERVEQCGCGHVPCLRAETNLAKNHDFGLLGDGGGKVPLRDGLRYLIQYRNPVRSIVSNYKLRLKSGHTDSRQHWEVFRAKQLGYWNRFMDKWVLGPEQNLAHLHQCAYHDLIAQPVQAVAACIEFLTATTPSIEAVAKVVETVGLRARDNLEGFAYHDAAAFRALEAATGDRMQRAGIPGYAESP